MIFLLFSFLFGLIAFIQPCTLAVNNIFLAYLAKEKFEKRFIETFKFTIVRILFLGILGMMAGFTGYLLLDFKYSVMIIVALVHVVFGVMMIAGRFRPMPVPNLNFSKIFAGKPSPGIAFALGIPACGVPLLLATFAFSFLVGSPAVGFLSLSLFGLAFSFPIIIISSLGRANEVMRYFFMLVGFSPYLGGFSLLGVGIYLWFQ